MLKRTLAPAAAIVLWVSSAAAQAGNGVLVDVESQGKPLDVGVGDESGHVGATCATPCRLSIPPGTYVLTAKAPGILQTREAITVPPEGARLIVRADRKGARVWGVLLTSFGGAMALMGGVMFGAVVASDVWDSYNSFYAVIGGVLFVGGVAQLIPGVLLLKNNHGGLVSPPPAQGPRPAAIVPSLTVRF